MWVYIWRVLPQPFPAPILVHEDEITKAKDCKSYCSVCNWGYVLAWILILCILGLLFSWIWIFMEINELLPQTFGWENLLRTFGSAIYLKDCSNNTISSTTATTTITPSINNNNDSIIMISQDCWTKSFTAPCVPIIAGTILIMTFICGIWCLLPVPLINLYSAVLNMRANLAWHLFFFIISIIVVSIYFTLDLMGLRKLMEMSINLEGGAGNNNNFKTISPRWELTQKNGQCCGVDNYKDWKSTNGLYPVSCCNTMLSVCSTTSPPNEANVWTKGCFKAEFNTIVFYGGLEILLIWLTYFISLGLYKLIVSLSLKQYEEARTEGDMNTSQQEHHQSRTFSPVPVTAADSKTPLLSSQQ